MEKTTVPLSTFDRLLIARRNPVFLVGVDEAGRGPLAGPVVACAAHIPPPVFPLVSPFINDSKKLTLPKREAAFSAMLQAGVSFGFGWAMPEEIDRCNILEATFNAMGSAVKRLARTLGAELPEAGRGLPLRHGGNPPVVSLHPRGGASHPLCGSRGNRSAVSPQSRTTPEARDRPESQLLGKGANPCRPPRLSAGLPRPFGPKVGFNVRKAVSQVEPDVPKGRGLLVLVDGPYKIKRLAVSQEAVVDGDARSLSIAAASIFAKVLRDRWMARLEALHPGYGLAKHKGYGTAAHLAALRVLGPSPIHRFSFAPVKMAAMPEVRIQNSEVRSQK